MRFTVLQGHGSWRHDVVAYYRQSRASGMSRWFSARHALYMAKFNKYYNATIKMQSYR